jgi:hypothetical protein
MGYHCEHFTVQELVGPEIFKARAERCWEMLDPALLKVIDQLRKRYGAITINNWQAGGPFSESGLRDPMTTTGAKYSMHKLGRAADLKFQAGDPREVQADLLERPTDFPLLTCMEDAKATLTWLHVDTRNHQQDRQIWIVNP